MENGSEEDKRCVHARFAKHVTACSIFGGINSKLQIQRFLLDRGDINYNGYA
jgi:hypothetical protein